MTDEMELGVFESKSERMVIGALAGYAIAGGFGALAGALIGREWD